VREDVTDIVLNIKEIALRMEGEGPKRMVVRKQGPGIVTAGDIQTWATSRSSTRSRALHARRGR
jgi:DNA-directed RNA polymerase alpha subunit